MSPVELPIGSRFWEENEISSRKVAWTVEWPFYGNAHAMLVRLPGWKPISIVPPHVQRELHTWTDVSDERRSVIARAAMLACSAVDGHAALRRLVLGRSRWLCVECGASVPEDDMPTLDRFYDGREPIRLETGQQLVMDHKLPRRSGGTHHPVNLQSLCQGCNARKAKTLDRALNDIVKTMGFRR